MANPWDNDEIVATAPGAAGQQAMPWDADPVVGDSSIPTLPTVQAERPNPADSMSGLERFSAGVGKSLVDTYKGLQQTAVDGLPTGLSALNAGVLGLLQGRGFTESALNGLAELGRSRQQMRAETADRRERDRALLDTGAGMAGNVVGTIAQVLGPGVAARGTAAAPALLPTTIRGNALQGGLIGAAQPVAQDGERVTNALVGGAAGGGGAAAVRGLGAAAGGAKNMLANTGMTRTDRQAANVLAREAENINQLNIQPSLVPGVQRTLGEASGDSGLMALENTMRARSRAAFEPIDLRNNTARVDQLQRIAGSEADMVAAEAAREAVVDGSLQRALREGRQFEGGLEAARNAEAQAARTATTAAEAENARLASLGLNGRVPVPAAPETGAQVSDGLRSLRGMVSQMQAETAARPSVQSAVNDVGRALAAADESVGSLYQVRQYIGDLLQGKAGADKSYARAASRELLQLRSALDDELAARAPSFPEYLDAYRSASKPINRMEVGREILAKSSGTAQDQLGNPILTPSGVARATNDLDAIAAKATDFKKARAADILTPQDMASLRAIQDDMQRIAQRNRSAAAGSQTMERLSIGERTAMRGLASRLPWVGPLFEGLQANANQRLNERLAFLLANPEEARRVLAALPSGDAGVLRKTLGQLALATGRSAQPTTD